MKKIVIVVAGLGLMVALTSSAQARTGRCWTFDNKLLVSIPNPFCTAALPLTFTEDANSNSVKRPSVERQYLLELRRGQRIHVSIAMLNAASPNTVGAEAQIYMYQVEYCPWVENQVTGKQIWVGTSFPYACRGASPNLNAQLHIAAYGHAPATKIMQQLKGHWPPLGQDSNLAATVVVPRTGLYTVFAATGLWWGPIDHHPVTTKVTVSSGR